MAHWLLERSWANPLMLDLFFKKYVWIAYAALIFAAAWLTARTVNTVLGAVIRPRPTVDLSARPAANPSAVAAGPRLPQEKLYALIGATPPAPPPTVADSAEPARPRNCDDTSAAPARTSLRAQLVGAVLAEPSRNSIVSVTDLTSRETRIYGVGDVIQGARFLAVERLRDDRDATGGGFRMAAIVCNDGQKEFIDFESGGAPAAVASVPSLGRAPVPAPGGGPPPTGAATGEGVKKTADNSYEVPRNVVDGALSNMSALATQARIVPSFKNGVANGFKLFSIQPNSLYANIGVENGDVIQRINGYEINSPDKALEVYQKLRESSHITIELERNGRVIRKEYNVTGP